MTDSVAAALIRIITSKTRENHPSEAAHPQKHELHNPVAFAKEMVVIFFVMYTETTMKYALLLFHALFCLVLCVPAVTRQVATHCPLSVRKQHCFPETVGLVVAAVLYATVPLGILCAVPFLGGRGCS